MKRARDEGRGPSLRSWTRSALGGAIVLLAVPFTVTAQELGEAGQDLGSTPVAEPLAIARLDGEISLDGMPDEAAWERIDPLPMMVFEPTWGAEPTEP
ncbi:MAG: hypothetical protein R3266_08570, partial [Gemmatimonadota bacterium]|nr:hypothetical protein [Gemmatimonadota bacterium]